MVKNAPSLLFFSDDHLLAKGLNKVFSKKYGLNIILFHPKDFRQSINIDLPKIILIDARKDNFMNINDLQWIKDYFQGIPIISLNLPFDEKNMIKLSRIGINQHVEINSVNWYKKLNLLVYAVLLDDEPAIQVYEK